MNLMEYDESCIMLFFTQINCALKTSAHIMPLFNVMLHIQYGIVEFNVPLDTV